MSQDSFSRNEVVALLAAVMLSSEGSDAESSWQNMQVRGSEVKAILEGWEAPPDTVCPYPASDAVLWHCWSAGKVARRRAAFL